ncbi:amidohydrolase [Salmonella enterica]|uniref:Amidohydrolase n=1 Tax=Salmonella enterica subsp. houtenae serovar 18:z36,z38:- TaxID=2577510 RepID=A0A729K854_SALHO|nr:amidohydrolase [Salmonella enterica]ECC1641627.1 amidohydrolase [Salmonella enterica subsp. houtenae]MBA2162988.1 amidohydrolase [Salmonella enterica subsp. houtenae serovar 18:z36,z38:-]EBD0801587.1 amidohydrolase [Salmonella enterica]EEP9800651.1 amidohydrolase [Salmonella enterica subsp. houtenae]
MKNAVYADTLLHNGTVWTADAAGTCHQAIALHDGRIMATGTDDELLSLIGPETCSINLDGRVVMPGLIDSHMHPYWGAKLLAGFSLDYQSLTTEETVARIQAHLENDDTPDDIWLLVRGWLRIGGSDVSRHDLDRLATHRPVMLFSNDCHFIALNSRGLDRLGINKETADPPDGNILRDASGEPIGIIEDAPAMRYYDQVSRLSPQEGAQVLAKAQQMLHRQGVTTVMDARTEPEALEAFKHLWHSGELTLRVHAAAEITPDEVKKTGNAEAAVSRIVALHQRYTTPGQQEPAPGITLSHAKFFIDGMLPNRTAYLREPYSDAPETCAHSYFTERQLTLLCLLCARAGLYPHMHIIADGAAELALDALEIMRTLEPDSTVRPALAHNDLMAPHQYARFAELDVVANLSWQWAGLTDELMAAYQRLLGETRINGLETHGKFFDSGVTVAYNSDWPIDPPDEWFNFQVGLTRRLSPDHPRLGSDRDLTVNEVLRAATINAAYALGREDVTGSLEPGKFADLIVLDRNPFTTPPDAFGQIKVLLTMVGGKVVWRADTLPF